MNNPTSNSLNQAIECFDNQYRELGMRSQRSYPNESLIRFLASRYFSLAPSSRKNIQVLEVGCGTGANLWMMAKEGFDTYGLDSSEIGLTLAREHLHGKWGVTADLCVGSFIELPYENAYFDAVVDVVSLQHLNLEDSQKALDEVVRVLKPEGQFFSYRLSDHSVMFLAGEGGLLDAATLANIDDPHMPLANSGPIAFWSPTLVNQMYATAGLRVSGIERVARTYMGGMFVEYLSITAVLRNFEVLPIVKTSIGVG